MKFHLIAIPFIFKKYLEFVEFKGMNTFDLQENQEVF